jgi:DNA-binding CsgD family transcriptional regulator
MPLLLFMPNSHTLIWQDIAREADDLLGEIRRRTWLPPAPFEHLAGNRFSANLQDGIVIVTMSSSQGERLETPTPRLSRRQKEVLKGVMDGLTTRQISLRLKLRPRTVLFHLAALKALYNASSRAELVRKVSILSGS